VRAVPPVSYKHLAALSDKVGIFEHAEFTVTRPEHGYCVDDVARGLIVALREPKPSAALATLTRIYLRFVIEAQVKSGQFHNRRGVGTGWLDNPTDEDCWGRAVWGLGTTVARSPDLAALALSHFDISVTRRSPWRRAMVFAALGAAEVLTVQPKHAGARSLLADAAGLLTPPVNNPAWPWPEPRLRYANASLPEVLLASGSLRDDQDQLDRGLAMLDWLLTIETNGDHLSVTPAGGWEPGEPRPGFDQQPIEVAALADACARAYRITGEPRWATAVKSCGDWFMGLNDTGVRLYDGASRGGCDGLQRHGRNENQGAESTLAMISTFQLVHRLGTSAAKAAPATDGFTGVAELVQAAGA
jgi:hypothetical protein